MAGSDVPEWQTLLTISHLYDFLTYIFGCVKVTLIYSVQILTLQKPQRRTI